ncbi:MAG: NfeD family protein [Planctomycetota bacterium]
MAIDWSNLAQLFAQTVPPPGGGGGDNTIYMVWAIVCFGIAIVLVVLEAFLPTGGVMGALAGVAAVVGIVLFFGFDTTWGLVSMAFTLLALPFILAGMIWIWPNTPIGRALTLQDEAEADAGQPPAPPPFPVGTLGKAVTDLRPVGACSFGGKRADCLAVGALIDAGTPVRVVDVEGTTIKVRQDSATKTDLPSA